MVRFGLLPGHDTFKINDSLEVPTRSPGSNSLPEEIIDLLHTTNIGYLSIVSPKGNPYCYPVTFFFAYQNVFFATPSNTAKLKFMSANPKVCFVVNNGKLKEAACSAMIQGQATILNLGQTLTMITSIAPTAIKFPNRWLGMLAFYARGKGLPEQRWLHKYKLVQLRPLRILYWLGYKFGKYLPNNLE